MDKVYKIVKHDEDGWYYSATHHCIGKPVRQTSEFRSGIVLRYIPNRFKKPRFGKILAFANPTYAKAFLHALWDKDLELWEAEANGVTPIQLLHSDALSNRNLDSWKEFWESSVYNHFPTMPAPPGTVGCESIKILRKVDSDTW